MKAIYPGTFDPITYGHLDVIDRASKLYDEVVIAIMHNPHKKTVFSIEKRIELIQYAIQAYPNVTVMAQEGLTVSLAEKINAKVLIRGIRAVMDYEYELKNATANQVLNPNIETVFLVSRPEFSFISSSAVKEIAMHHGDIRAFVSDEVAMAMKEYYLEQEEKHD